MQTKKISLFDLNLDQHTPVLNYCRTLIEQGIDPTTRLECYRNNSEPDLIVNNIGQAAKLTIKNSRLVAYKQRA